MGGHDVRGSRVLLNLVLLAATAGPVGATTSFTYTLAGAVTPTNSRDGGIVNYVDLHAPMSFSFTVATALAANSEFRLHDGDVLSWIATAGKPTSTIMSDTIAYPHATLGHFGMHLFTDASGNISFYNITAAATDPALGGRYGVSPNFSFENLSSRGHSTEGVRFIENGFGQNTGGALCSTGCAQSFTRTTNVSSPQPAPSVPEPSSWMLMLAGFGGMGVAMRMSRKAKMPQKALAPY